MKLPRYSGLIVFLWISVIGFGFYAFAASPFQLTEELTLNQWNLKEFLDQTPSKPAKIATDSVKKAANIEKPEPESRNVDSSKQRILLAGDSMAECLLFGIRDYAKGSGHKVKLSSWYGSNTMQWAKSDTLETTIKKFKPTLIIFCLGANELMVPNIWNREKYLKKIIRKLDSTKYVWISPPNWRKDTGLTDMISHNVPESQLFISKDLKLDRRKDGAHPTYVAAKLWADTVAKWIVHKSAFPIVMVKNIKPKTPTTRTMGIRSVSAKARKLSKGIKKV